MKHIIAIIAILAIASVTWAGSGTTTKIGNMEYHRYSDGTTGTTTRIGDIEYHRHSDGTTGTTTRIGDTEYHRYTSPPPQNKAWEYKPGQSMTDYIKQNSDTHKNLFDD